MRPSPPVPLPASRGPPARARTWARLVLAVVALAAGTGWAVAAALAAIGLAVVASDVQPRRRRLARVLGAAAGGIAFNVLLRLPQLTVADALAVGLGTDRDDCARDPARLRAGAVHGVVREQPRRSPPVPLRRRGPGHLRPRVGRRVRRGRAGRPWRHGPRHLLRATWARRRGAGQPGGRRERVADIRRRVRPGSARLRRSVDLASSPAARDRPVRQRGQRTGPGRLHGRSAEQPRGSRGALRRADGRTRARRPHPAPLDRGPGGARGRGAPRGEPHRRRRRHLLAAPSADQSARALPPPPGIERARSRPSPRGRPTHP